MQMDPTDAKIAIKQILQAPNAFAVLGLTTEAVHEASTVRHQYRRLAILVHPDKCSLPDAKEAFHLLSGSFERLHDPVKQEKYLLELTSTKYSSSSSSKQSHQYTASTSSKKRKKPSAPSSSSTTTSSTSTPSSSQKSDKWWESKSWQDIEDRLHREETLFKEEMKRKQEHSEFRKKIVSERRRRLDEEKTKPVLDFLKEKYGLASESDTTGSSDFMQQQQSRGESATSSSSCILTPSSSSSSTASSASATSTNANTTAAPNATTALGNQYVCWICQRQFRDQAHLLKHESFSSLHRTNIQKQRMHEQEKI
eukprot:TRINITY_DN1283_c0_g1_i1.p1 TRINITY_DN1283_c0_g1~~TRINITY_DN1283_c0_g1_i1.p1  ORF type:complete len:311 (-),score=101.36 TRINITY_DN1283_c0_g1_i1:99-1031(-)